MSDPNSRRSSWDAESEDGSLGTNLRPDVQALGRKLVEFELIDPEGFMTCCQTSEDVDSTSIIQALEQSGKLTPYQASRITQGSVSDIQFDDYVLIDRLGAGGMGEVFKARNLHLGRIEAIKTIHGAAQQSEALVRRFQQEARVLARLEHPAIVPIYRVGRFGNSDYIAMKFVEGVDLRAKVEEAEEKGNQIPVGTACRWISEAADALSHAHQHNVIHRDIKPGNLMVSDVGRIIVLDMGIARLADPVGPRSAGLTLQSRGMGTPEFMPPEQWADATAVTPESDIYALGCTLFFLLVGKVPFKRDTMVDLMRAHAKEAPPDLCKLRSEIPDGLNRVVAKMLAKSPADRYHTMQQLIVDLLPYVEELPSGMIREVPMHPNSSPVIDARPNWNTAPKKRIAWLPIIIFSLGLVGIGAAASFMMMPHPSPQNGGTGGPETKLHPLESMLEDLAIKHPALWKDANDLKLELESSGIPVHAALQKAEFSEKDIDIFRERVLDLVAIKEAPQWLQDYQKDNSLIWPQMTTLVAFAEKAAPDGKWRDDPGLIGPSGAITEETAKRFHEAIISKAETFLKELYKANPTAWPNDREMLEYAKSIIPIDDLRDEATLQQWMETLKAETALLSSPFNDVDLTAFPAEKRDQAQAAKVVIPELLAVLETPRDSAWLIQGGFVDTKDLSKRLTKVKVDFPVYISFTTSKDGYFTPTQLDSHTLFVWKMENSFFEATPVGDVHVLGFVPFRFDVPGIKRFTLYATEKPLVSRQVVLGTEDATVWDRYFRSPLLRQRVLTSFESGKPLPGLPKFPSKGKWTRTTFELEVVE